MNTGLIAMRYANALFQLGAQHEDLLTRFYNDCNFLLKTLTGSDELVIFLRNPVVKPSVKKKFMRQNFHTFFHESSLKFMDLVIENNREMLFSNIIIDFMTLYRNHRGVKSVTVTTAIPVDESFKSKIIGVIEEKLKVKVELNCKVDEGIIGGLVVMIDGKQADGSIAGKLRAMKKKLLLK